MIKNEEKSVNGNTKFKLKLVKIAEPESFTSLIDKMRYEQIKYNVAANGVYQQLGNKNIVTYSAKKTFSIKDLESVLTDLYKK